MLDAEEPSSEFVDAVRQTRMLDTPPEQFFDDLVLVAAEIFGTPIAFVDFVDQHRHWLKAQIGLDKAEFARVTKQCLTLRQENGLVIEDLSQDPRLCLHPLVVQEPFLRFYAAVPFKSSHGTPVGMIGVADRQPRSVRPGQMRALAALARQVERHWVMREQSETVAECERQLARLMSMTESTLEGIAILNAQNHFEFVNLEQSRMFGFEKGVSLVGKSWDDVFDEATAKQFLDELLPICRSLGQWRGEFCGRRYDGQPFDTEIVLNSLPDGGYTLLCIDLTERRTAIREYITSKFATDSAFHAKNDFLSRVLSHEIRTPLTSILGFADLLLDENYQPMASPEQVEAIRIIKRNGQHLLATLNDVLKLTTLEPRSNQPPKLAEPEKPSEPEPLGDLHRRDPGHARASTPLAPNKGIASRILVAEDGNDARLLLGLLLEKAGFAVTLAQNGKIAIERYLEFQSTHRFDAILLDLSMPVMDGYQAAKALKELGFRGPIIALTAHALQSDCEECLNSGFADYLAKPFQWAALLEVIARNINANRCSSAEA